MPDIFHLTPLNRRPQIVIESYTVKTDVFYTPDNTVIDSQHIKIYKYLDDNPLVARAKAFNKVTSERNRLAKSRYKFVDPDEPTAGISLYLTYRKYELVGLGKSPKYFRYYILDGKRLQRRELLERLEHEVHLLMQAGAEFDVTNFEYRGTTYEIVADASTLP